MVRCYGARMAHSSVLVPRALQYVNSIQIRCINLPRIAYKVDPALDEVAERAKILRPILRISDLILESKRKAMEVKTLNDRRRELAIKDRNVRVLGYLNRFPNIFVTFRRPGCNQRWCRLTRDMMEFLEEEKRIYEHIESSNVLKLRRLLMMSRHRRLPTEKIMGVRRVLGLPGDFLTCMVPKYPEFFRIASEGLKQYLELMLWDEDLAISELEKGVVKEGWNRWRLIVTTRGKPLPFKVLLSPGLRLKKKRIEYLNEWQKLPYTSPYEDWCFIPTGTPLSEKRVVAFLHEFLSLTIERKVRLRVLKPFREEFGLPQKVVRLLLRFPGIFYMSQRGGIKTFILREGYYISEQIYSHPLVIWKAKLAEMAFVGPRMKTSHNMPKESMKKEITGSECNSANFDDGSDVYNSDSTSNDDLDNNFGLKNNSNEDKRNNPLKWLQKNEKHEIW